MALVNLLGPAGFVSASMKRWHLDSHHQFSGEWAALYPDGLNPPQSSGVVGLFLTQAHRDS
jgi:hypothetical protein